MHGHPRQRRAFHTIPWSSQQPRAVRERCLAEPDDGAHGDNQISRRQFPSVQALSSSRQSQNLARLGRRCEFVSQAVQNGLRTRDQLTVRRKDAAPQIEVVFQADANVSAE